MREMKVASAITLLAVFCFGAIVVSPTSALLPSTNPDLAVRLVDPGIIGADLIDPQHLTFDQYHHWNGTNFEANVYIENLDSGWALTNASFTLSYNASLTSLVSATLNTSWAGPGNLVDTSTPGIINVVANNPTNPSGNVLVLNITFNIQGQSFWPPQPYGYFDTSHLDFSNISLNGDSGLIPVDLVKHGVVVVYAGHVHPAYDLWVTSIALDTSKTVIGQGFSLTINVTGENHGSQNSTFIVTAYANTTPIGSKNLTVQNWQANSTSITWNTTGFKGKYQISASPSPPEGEYGYIHNLTDGWITVAIVGDITGPTTGVPDGKVDIRDLAAIAKIYGVYWWDPSYNINYDLTGFQLGVPDRKIDIKDLALVAKNYGKTDP